MNGILLKKIGFYGNLLKKLASKSLDKFLDLDDKKL